MRYVQRVWHRAHPRGDLTDPAFLAAFKAFNKRPLSTVTDEELLQWWRPEVQYVNFEEPVTHD